MGKAVLFFVVVMPKCPTFLQLCRNKSRLTRATAEPREAQGAWMTATQQSCVRIWPGYRLTARDEENYCKV